ncbi:MAG: hypothetical protein GY696_04255, partial [Gammaproteobacteria bacterium]|nr:hypothetical protein [Gammaproteobacteria bacterium]
MLNASLPPANALTDAQKNAYLCAHLGAEGLRTFSTNPTMAQRAQMQHQAFRQAAKDHFSPRITKAKAMWDFHRRIQEPDECVDEYLTALRTMTADCDFRDQQEMDTNLLIQLIEGCNDKRTQEELLAAQNLNLDRVMDLMRAHETARTESAQMNHVPPHRMNMKFQGHQRQQRQQRPQPQGKVCHRCGSNSHMGSSSQCPAKDKQCLSCKKKGHFAKVCRQKLDQT